MDQPQDQSWTARLPVAELEQERAKAAKQAKPPEQSQPQQPATPEWQLYLKGMREWARIHFRRWAHLFHGAAAGTLAVGPAAWLHPGVLRGGHRPGPGGGAPRQLH